MEARGVPCVLLATGPFEGLARQLGESYGFARTRVAIVEHPLGGISKEAVHERAAAVAEAVLGLLSAQRGPR